MEAKDDIHNPERSDGYRLYASFGNGLVQILHQTAKDFLSRPENWEGIRVNQDPNFDINTTLLEICLHLYRRKARHIEPRNVESSWSIRDAMTYAKNAEINTGKSQMTIVDAIDLALKDYSSGWPRPKDGWSWAGRQWDLPVWECAVSANLLLSVAGKFAREEIVSDASLGPKLLGVTLSPYLEPAFDRISIPMVRYLLEAGADPNTEVIAWTEGFSAWQRLLMRLSIGDNPFRRKPGFDHWLKLCCLFLDFGADPNTALPIGRRMDVRHRGDEETFPLHYVLHEAGVLKFPQFLELVETLLQHGADVTL